MIFADKNRLHESRIILPSYIRAPLALRDGTRYYSVVDNRKGTKTNSLEIITSTIDPAHWKHLWRLEFSAEDRPGNTHLLYSLLENRGIETIHSETSVNQYSIYHSAHLILSCRSYSSDIDATPAVRDAENWQDLSGLYRDLLAYFGDQIAIPMYRETPILKVRRMNAYRRLHDDVDQNERFLNSRGGLILRNSSMLFSKRMMNHLENKFGQNDNLYYTSLVDTKTRLVRTTIYDSTKPARRRVVILFNSNDRPVLAELFRVATNSSVNILQQYLRPASESEMQLVIQNYEYRPIHFAGHLRRLDLLVEFVGKQDSGASTGKFLESLNGLSRQELEVFVRAYVVERDDENSRA